jgi:phospholipid/cholesterol/gamma-HCH transport system substrate-binding protein
MKNAFMRDLLTGLTTLAGLVGLVVMLWLFGELKDVGVKYYEFVIRLNVATGLTSTSPVALNGVRVGTVRQITLAEDPTQGAFVRVKVKEGTRIPENFKVYLDRGFVGETTLQLELPKGPDAPPVVAYVKPGDTYERHAMTLFESIRAPLEEPLARIAQAAEGIDKLAATYDDVGKRVKDLFEPRTIAEVDGGRPPTLPSTLARIDLAVTHANQWIADPALREQSKGVIAKADHLLDTAQETADALKRTAQSAEEQIAKVGGKVSETADQAGGALRKVSDAAEEITKLSAAANSGDGTLGLLVRNPDLYNSIKDAASRLERVLVELQVLLEKYRTEGIPLKL